MPWQPEVTDIVCSLTFHTRMNTDSSKLYAFGRFQSPVFTIHTVSFAKITRVSLYSTKYSIKCLTPFINPTDNTTGEEQLQIAVFTVLFT